MTSRDIIAGADGCHAGWICITHDQATGTLSAALHETARALLLQRPEPVVLALDIPIGLTESGPRTCDREARRLLRAPRASSVFPAPIRPALAARTREQASAITERADGRRVGVQAWAIVPKIRGVDALMTRDLQRRVREVHPEVSFAVWNGGAAMKSGKKRRAGREERLRLVAEAFGASAFERVRQQFLRRDVASDDILDAFAALWTACRILAGSAQTLPASPPRDVRALAMEIVA